MQPLEKTCSIFIQDGPGDLTRAFLACTLTRRFPTVSFFNWSTTSRLPILLLSFSRLWRLFRILGYGIISVQHSWTANV